MYWTPRGHCCEDTVAFVTNATALPIPLRESRDGSNCTCPSCMCERMSLTFASSGGKPDAFEIAPVRSGCCCWTIVAGGVAAACRRIVVRALGRGRARRQAGISLEWCRTRPLFLRVQPGTGLWKGIHPCFRGPALVRRCGCVEGNLLSERCPGHSIWAALRHGRSSAGSDQPHCVPSHRSVLPRSIVAGDTVDDARRLSALEENNNGS